jgi:hypothetical protein
MMAVAVARLRVSSLPFTRVGYTDVIDRGVGMTSRFSR